MKTTKVLTYDTKIQHQQIESERMHIMNHDVATVSLIVKRVTNHYIPRFEPCSNSNSKIKLCIQFPKELTYP